MNENILNCMREKIMRINVGLSFGGVALTSHHLSSRLWDGVRRETFLEDGHKAL